MNNMPELFLIILQSQLLCAFLFRTVTLTNRILDASDVHFYWNERTCSAVQITFNERRRYTLNICVCMWLCVCVIAYIDRMSNDTNSIFAFSERLTFIPCSCFYLMSKMTDRPVEIEPKDWQKLKNLYTPDGLKNYIAYTTIDNYIRWFEQAPNVKHVKIFSLNGDFSDGTFVVTVNISSDQWLFGFFEMILFSSISSSFFFVQFLGSL